MRAAVLCSGFILTSFIFTFIFTFGAGPARSFRVSAPSGFDHVPAPFPQTESIGNLGTQIVSLLLEIDFPYFPLLLFLLLFLLLIISITYYIYISKFIETILREKKIELDREVPQTIGVTWPKPDGVETRKDPEKNKNTERT